MASTLIKRFGILSPALGKREDFPSLLLNKSFTPDLSEVQIWNGEIRKAKLRKAELFRTAYAIESIDVSGDTITIDGDHTAEFVAGAGITCYNTSDSQYETFTIDTTSTAVSGQTVISISVSGDITSSTPDEYVFVNTNVSSNNPSEYMFRSVITPDGNPIILYKLLRLSNEAERLTAFTKAYIYFWDTNLTKWQVIHTCSADCEYWDADQYGDYLVATNNIDRPVQWDGGSETSFTTMDTQLSATTSNYIAKAEFIKPYRNYIFLGNVELSNGSRYQHYGWWCNVGEGVSASGWKQDIGGDAGYAYIEGAGHISGGFGLWQGYLCIFKRFSIRKLWYTGGTIPFEQDELFPNVGCSAPGSLVNDKIGRLYFYGSDKNFREIGLGKISQPIDNTSRDVNPSLLNLLRVSYIDEYDEIWWTVPYGSSATANNKVIKYKDGKWLESDIDVVAFGQYCRQTSYTWDTLPFSTWDTWGWDSWDATDANSNFPVDLCSDSDGNTYEAHGAYTDIGSTYTSYFVLTTDLANKQALAFYKRLLQMHFYLKREGSGTLDIHIKRDNEQNWQSLGSVNLSGDNDILRQRIAVDTRGRHFLIKCSSTSKFNFLGMEFEYIYAGER